MPVGSASATTFGPIPSTLIRTWHLFDARNQIVGRLAQRAACLLQGKHKPTWSPHVDSGDTVVIVNAEKVKFTGHKWERKVYRYHTGYPGGLKEIRAVDMLQKHPTFILRKAIMGMIHKNTFKHERAARLKIYVGPDHPHQSQFPHTVMAKWEKQRVLDEKDDMMTDTYSRRINPIIREEKNAMKRAEKEKEIDAMVKSMIKANDALGGKLGTVVGSEGVTVQKEAAAGGKAADSKGEAAKPSVGKPVAPAPSKAPAAKPAAKK